MEPNNHGVPPRLPGEFIREELKRRGWTQADLARILDRSLTRLNEIIKGKQEITPEMAVALGVAFDTPPEIWLRRESEYRLHQQEESLFRLVAEHEGSSLVKKRKQVFEVAPVKELQKRGWIRPGEDLNVIEDDLLNLLEVESLGGTPRLQVVMRKSNPDTNLSPGQRAWCHRVRQIAKTVMVPEYRPENLPNCIGDLRKIAAYSQEVRKVPTILASYGIRYVVVEPLSSGKIDGMTTWLSEQNPVIGMSLRYDRIDNFWHTLCHELSHVRHGDALSVDVFDDISEPGALNLDVKPAMERRADSEAASTLIPAEELESFIRRVSPLYSKERINQFANRIKIHPGIIVGQLQWRHEIGHAANREMLVKVRDIVTPIALTDGWGTTIDPRVFK